MAGEEVTIGPIEKMSKSKKNTVDPDDIIATYGADVARWFMLSDFPARSRCDLERRARAGLVALCAAAVAGGERVRRHREGGAVGAAGAFGADALALRKVAHGTLDKVSTGIERMHYNVCLAHIREFTNALADVLAQIRLSVWRNPGA